jgi:histidine triad (HIT) family protein
VNQEGDKMDCVFCRILAGELPATFVHRDDLVSVFMDIQPVNPGHLLVVPNRHVEFLSDTPPETGSRMFIVAQQTVRSLRDSGLKCEGVNLFLADGEAAGQEIAHAHLHVFPRWSGDRFALKFSDQYAHKPTGPELESCAQRIIAACRRHNA